MRQVFVDSNVLLDVLTDDPQWFEWSAAQLDRCAEDSRLCINPLIYAEVSVGFNRVEELNEAVPAAVFAREELPWDARFLAGKAYKQYRRRSGSKRSPLADSYIGAHAAIVGAALLTRDAVRCRTYFPTLEIIAPD